MACGHGSGGSGVGFDPRAQLLRQRRDRGQIVRDRALRRAPGPAPRVSATRKKLLEGRGLDDESRRHGDAGALQLAETAALAADLRPVGKTQVGKPADQLRIVHVTRIATAQCRMVTMPRPPSTRMR